MTIISLIQSRVGEDGLVTLDHELNFGDKVMMNSGPLKTKWREYFSTA